MPALVICLVTIAVIPVHARAGEADRRCPGFARKPYLAAPLHLLQSEPLGNTAVVRACAAAILTEAVTTIAALCRSFLRRS